jgi:alpha-galactosidase
VVAYRWDFGDGTATAGGSATHTWTEPGTYSIGLEATALDGSRVTQHADIRITGHLSTVFDPAKIRRLGD